MIHRVHSRYQFLHIIIFRQKPYSVASEQTQHITFAGMFTVALSRPLKTSEKMSEKILRLIKENKDIITKELAIKVGISTRSIEGQIKSLKDKKGIERIEQL
jgi:predicted HTH transcriptional regulator